MRNFIFIIFFACSNFAIYGQSNIDSLKLALKNAKVDSTKCVTLIALGEEVYLEEPDTAISFWKQAGDLAKKIVEQYSSPIVKNRFLSAYATCLSNQASIYSDRDNIALSVSYCNEAFKIYKEINDKSGMAAALSNLGYIYAQQAEVDKALDNFLTALKFEEEIKENTSVAQLLNNIGAVYMNQGNVPTALEYFHRSLKVSETYKYQRGVATALNSISDVFMKQGDIDKALEYMNKILKLHEELKDKQGIAESLNNLAYICDKQGNTDKALDYYFKSLKLREETNDKRGMGISFDNIGYVYENRGENDKAIEYYNRSIKIREEINDQYGLVSLLNNVAFFLHKKGQDSKAEDYAVRSLKIANQLGYPESIQNAAWTLKLVYEKQKKYKESFEMYELSTKMRDSISNETTRKASIKKQFQIEYENEAIKDSVANVVKANDIQIKHEQAISQQRTYTYGGFAGLALMLVVAGVSFKAFKNKQKANIIITEQKLIAEAQKSVIEEKQREIIDSINYARRIQRAHLPSEKYISRKMNELKS